MSGNPFDPMSSATPQPAPFGARPGSLAPPNNPNAQPGETMTVAPNGNPFGTTAPVARQQVYGAPPAAASQNAMVMAPLQSYPYAMPAPYPAGQPRGNPFAPTNDDGALVPAQTQNSHWAAPASTAVAGPGFDPFASPPVAPSDPPPPQVFAPPPAPTPQPGLGATVELPQRRPPTDVQQPTANLQRYDPSEGEKQQQHQQANARTYGNVDRMNPEQNYNSGAGESPQRVLQQREQQTAEMGRQLARTTPGASPLPKPELIRKKGFVLSRISFRTIVMKKWKQSFWVQYGPHTMLWFRSDTDFNDWLNNPYHNQVQRNFLIKLAVNFVHDLYKPSVRGYQVTQCRTKPYGSKMIRQFKLERWMDYGPTIAAAFGSYNPKEVDDLRQAIVECMRNTPLSNGIRATGAVRQQPSRESEEDSDRRPERQRVDSGEYDRREYARADGVAQPNADILEQSGNDVDLLDTNNWDDVSVQQHSVAPSVHAGMSEQFGASTLPQQSIHQQPYSAPILPQQGNPYGVAPPQQLPAYAGHTGYQLAPLTQAINSSAPGNSFGAEPTSP